MAHPNAEILRQADEAMERGDTEGFLSHYADDVVVHAAGSNRLAGDYEGLGQLQDLFGRFLEAMGEYTFQNHAYLADDDHGVILQRGSQYATARRGSSTRSSCSISATGRSPRCGTCPSTKLRWTP